MSRNHRKCRGYLITFNTGVVDTSGELDFRSLERIVRGEVDVDGEDAALVGGAGGAHDHTWKKFKDRREGHKKNGLKNR